VVDGLERPAVQPVQPMPTLLAHVDRSHFAKHPQMLGHLRLSEPELAHQVVDRTLPAGEGVQDLAPPGLGHRVECICRRRRASHYADYIPIWAYVMGGGRYKSIEPEDLFEWRRPFVRNTLVQQLRHRVLPPRADVLRGKVFLGPREIG